MPLARGVLQRLASVRLQEAQALRDAGLHAGAYYLAGYAVELALKACIAAQFKAEIIPDWASTRDFRTHRPRDLVRLSGLDVAFEEERKLNSRFSENWRVVANWTTNSRYEETSPERAEQLVEAVGDPNHGVLRWIRTHW